MLEQVFSSSGPYFAVETRASRVMHKRVMAVKAEFHDYLPVLRQNNQLLQPTASGCTGDTDGVMMSGGRKENRIRKSRGRR